MRMICPSACRKTDFKSIEEAETAGIAVAAAPSISWKVSALTGSHMAHRFISPFGFGPLGTPRPISDLPGDELHDPELQAAFNLDPVSNEKPIIQVVSFVEQRLIEELHKHPDLFKDMDRRRLEEIVAELFDGFGYAVELTKRTRDGGKDVIAIKRAEVDVRFLISCKRPDPGNPVRVGAVRELHSVKES